MTRRDVSARLAAVALVAVSVGACGARTALVLDDGGVAMTDLGHVAPRDFGAPRDMRAPTDMPIPIDMPAPVDMAAPPDMHVAVDAGPPRTTCVGTSGPTSSTRCSQRVRMGVLVRSMTSCFVDVRPATDEQGTLTFDCEGGGAVLVFDGGARFTGTSSGVDIDVCTGTTGTPCQPPCNRRGDGHDRIVSSHDERRQPARHHRSSSARSDAPSARPGPSLALAS